jgi:Zn-finger nucleic acid-binding protein
VELFSVICTTCNSKLKVRERSVIGHILACPKCQGMVMIQPPAGWLDPGETAAAPAPMAPVVAKQAPSHSSSTFEDAAALLSAPATAVSAPPVAVPTEASPLPAPTEWISPQTQAMRKWLLIGGLSSIGAVVLIGALVFALGGGGDDPVVAANENETKAAEEPTTEPTDPAEETPLTDPVKSSAESPMSDPAPLPMPEVTVPPATDPAETTTDPSPMPDKPPTDVVPAPEGTEPASEAPKPLNTFGESTLKEFGDLIEDRPPGENAPAEPMPDAPPMPMANATEPPTLVTDEEPLPRPDARKIDVARRLADPLEAFEMNDVALADFVQLLTDMTALPITLDTTALPALKVSPETKISVSLKNTKVGELLSAALRPHNLAYVATETQVVIVPAASLKTELREIKHDVSDLAKTEAEAKVLAEAIHACVAPSDWDDVDGRGSLRTEGTIIIVAQTPEAHFAIVVLCEKLRLARKLPTRSAYPASVLTLTPRAVAANAVLDTPITMNFVPPTRLGRVAEYAKRATGVRMLVDWRALAEVGWTPEGEVKTGVANQSFATFLDRLTRRMEITWRVIDSTTVELTTPAALAVAPDVEVYPVAATDGAELIARLQKDLGMDLFAMGAPGALRYDSVGQALIARLPQPAQRKLIAALAK